MTDRPDSEGWLVRAAFIVAGVTVVRLLLLAFNRTDLFVDESQYWLWGQEPAFGYYSKPPLIGWVIGAVTWLAGSDTQFWVRAPSAVFHGATALILGALAARLHGRGAAVWVAVSYVSLPFVAVGSLLISTDTIMAPFFAAALFFWWRLVTGGRAVDAALAGAMAGAAFLAKYAAFYFLLGVALAAILSRQGRIGLANALILLAAFAAVILPNVIWNLTNDLVTVSHTVDNVGWLRESQPMAGLNPAGMAEFFTSQFAVFGPVLFAALIWRVFRHRAGMERMLLCFAVPAVVIVTGQALMDKAYANWAVAAYFAAVLVVVPVLLARAPRLLALSLALNGTVSLALPLLTLAPGLQVNGEPLLARYLGRADLSARILAEAERAGGLPVVADHRDLLADLFHAARDGGPPVYAPRPEARPDNYYEQMHALPEGFAGRVLWVSDQGVTCRGVPLAPVTTFDVAGGAYQGKTIRAYVAEGECLDARP